MPQLEFAKNFLFMSLKALLVAAAVFIMWKRAEVVKKRSHTISQSTVCPQRILRKSSEPQQKGERCESQVDSEVKVG